MTAIQYNIHLTSDAEPGTGFGGELVNDFIPRNAFGHPELPASHVKGLMRNSLVNIARIRRWLPELILEVFGKSEHERIDEVAAFTLSSVSLTGDERRDLVVRTAVGEFGVAADTSLRTTECIAVGSKFVGDIYPSVEPDSVEDLAWRLALLSVFAVGSNRNRGSGSCYVEIAGETRGPGDLVKTLDAKLQTWEPRCTHPRSKQATSPIQLTGKPVVLQLVFHAHSPICCPEIPDKSNVMSTGFSIPASAVQGLLLTEINRRQPELADAIFANPLFRAWPMQPCYQPTKSQEPIQSPELPESAIRVSLTHRAAKYSVSETYGVDDFHDEAIEPRQPNDDRKGAPLKGSDGVLLRYASGEVNLWRASDMPHVITSHGVHTEAYADLERERNVFTVDAMAPLVWQGLVVVPEDAAEPLQQLFSKVSQVSIGKSRTVRGLGTLKISRLGTEIPAQWRTHGDKTVWVVQSPIPFEHNRLTAQETFRKMADAWGNACGVQVTHVWANSGILFGWNRMQQGRQAAQAVILPGSVIEFGGKVDDEWTREFFASGKCAPEGRQQGFGAISVHPGKASTLYENKTEIPTKSAAPDNYAAALKIILAVAALSSLPSVSQIRAVQQRIVDGGTQKAADYLEEQMKRPSGIWAAWNDCHNEIKRVLKDYERCAHKALEVFADLAAMKNKDGEVSE